MIIILLPLLDLHNLNKFQGWLNIFNSQNFSHFFCPYTYNFFFLILLSFHTSHAVLEHIPPFTLVYNCDGTSKLESPIHQTLIQTSECRWLHIIVPVWFAVPVPLKCLTEPCQYGWWKLKSNKAETAKFRQLNSFSDCWL